MIALDEGADADECPPEGLVDRLAFHVNLEGIALRDAVADFPDAADLAKAREQVAFVEVPDAAVAALCAAALALGISSLRASVQAVRVARANAALEGRTIVGDADAAVAARLVLAPRATRWPPEEQPEDDAANPPENPGDGGDGGRSRFHEGTRLTRRNRARRGEGRDPAGNSRAVAERGPVCACAMENRASRGRRTAPRAADAPSAFDPERRAAVRRCTSWKPYAPQRRGNASDDPLANRLRRHASKCVPRTFA